MTSDVTTVPPSKHPLRALVPQAQRGAGDPAGAGARARVALLPARHVARFGEKHVAALIARLTLETSIWYYTTLIYIL